MSGTLAETPCPLHDATRCWSLSNCYVDLWIEVLHGWGLDPRAALAFTVMQGFEGDQFTFFKYPPEDLEAAYGIMVYELALYDGVEAHVEMQQRRGNLTLVEVDGWFLPDTQGTAYQLEHQKTTIGIDRISRTGRLLGYYHNGGYHTLQGEDYDGIFGLGAHRPQGVVLPPYVEVARRARPALRDAALREAAMRQLRRHMTRRPAENPILAFQAEFDRAVATLLARDGAYFHLYSFNTLRQLGANFELLGNFLEFLQDERLAEAVPGCNGIAASAKLLQFRLARMQARQRAQPCDDLFETLAGSYVSVMQILERWAG